MFAVIVAFLLLAFQPAPATVADCLLRSGYSVTVTPSEVTALYGAPADEWPDVLASGLVIGTAYVDTDTGTRWVRFYAWRGGVYAFVAKHADDPARGAGDVWHGDCLLRLNDGA